MEDTFTVSDPFLYGEGPPTFSTSTGLVRYHPMVWDANGYYRALGVSVYATRGELRKAYRRKKGWRSPRLTYILKQLLNEEVRRAYDATPLGEVFWDKYVEDYKRRQASAAASKLRRAGMYDQAEEMSFYDSPFSDIEDEEEILRLSETRATLPRSWPWSYYLWQSHKRDTDRLRRWQSALVDALGGQHYEVAVGFVGGVDLPCVVQRVGYRVVAFLGETSQPCKEVAEQAAQQIKEQSKEI